MTAGRNDAVYFWDNILIVDKLGALGTIPPQVEALMNKLKTDEGAELPRKRMSKVSKSIKINAPLDKVFSVCHKP